MKLSKVISTSALALTLATGMGLAQQRGHGNDRPTGGGDRSGSVRPSNPEPRYRSGSETPRDYHPPRSSTNPQPGGGGTSGRGGGQNYLGYPYYTYNDWYYANNFLYGLWNRYPYFAVNDYAWRYSVGDSPIDRNILRLALQDSYESANALVARVNEMSALIDDYEAGKIDRAGFQKRFDDSLENVRKMAKSIRKDDRLAYLDQRKGVPYDQPEAARSVAELRALVSQLRDESRGMRDALETYYVKDYTRTVDLEHLKQPSFKSMSERIDKIAKSIEKSAGRL